MRSILIFFAVVLASLGAFWVLREEPVTPQGGGSASAGGAILDRPTTERPRTGAGQSKPKASQNVPTVAANAPGALSNEAWRAAATKHDIIRMEDAWGFDLGDVDFSKEVLCTVDGIEITQADLRSRVLLTHAQGLLNSEVFEMFGKLAAEESGNAYGVSDEEWDRYFADYCTKSGLPAETLIANLAVQMKIPASEVIPIRRQMLETILAFFPAVDSPEQLPGGIARLFPSEAELKDATTIGALMRSQIGVEEGEEPVPGGALMAFMEPMSLMFTRIGSDIRFRRVWTNLDHPMPEGALLGVYTGELDDETILPPWECGDQVQYITIDAVWNKVEAMMNRSSLESDLKDTIWSKVLTAKLAQAGVLPSTSRVWNIYAGQHLSSMGSFFQLDAQIHINGYPSRAAYREDLSITEGMLALQDEGWQSEAVLQDFYERNKFFVLGWTPNVEVALFVPIDPAAGLDAKSDWPRAKANADAFLAKVNAGEDFSVLRMEHNRALAESYRDGFGQEVADSFASEFGMGEFQGTYASTNQILRQTLYRDHVDGASALRNAISRLGKGEVSQPWKTSIGYVVMRVHSARLDRLEGEYEDSVGLTTHLHNEWTLRNWANSQLADAEFALGK
ncbi:MAG: hypothetical protein P8N31_02925 [Planctomycetota bacterium]|nr:hypothetical protein [Planctomycetota bacterium]MDG2142484.1 hypothetical protein [Planctomycetota bacterium]